jgi:glycosyltransferase involved in cell wall biosynthesis
MIKESGLPDQITALRPKKPVVLVYADPLLAPSVTFVKSQAEALRDFLPFYVGARRYCGAGLELPAERAIAINRKGTDFGKIKEIPFKVFGYAPLFFRKVRRINPVLIHAHTGPGGVTALPLANHLSVPLVTTFHGADVTTAEPSLANHRHYTARSYSRSRQKLQSRGALFIAVSKFVRAKLLQQGFSLDRTVLHYIGINTAFFSPDLQVAREPIVLFVGTLHEGKGCEYALRAMAKVQSLLPETEFVILGNGPLRAVL